MGDTMTSWASGSTGNTVGARLFHERTEQTPTPGKRPIAVVGAGFSGTIATLQLLRRLPPDQPVLLCERAASFASGVAYATGENDHLLNVRAANMSALVDEPLHFEDWLKRRGGGATEAMHAQSLQALGMHPTDSGLFATRGLYGQYLRSILDYAMRETAGHAQLRLLPDEVCDIVAIDGGGYELICASGLKLEVAGVVLSMGNLPSEDGEDPRICRNPWGEKAWRKLEGDMPILIVGTGLTMVDLAIAIRRRGFQGHIHALSRGGLLPTRHEPGSAWPTPQLSMAEEQSMRLLLARVRDEVFAAAQQGIGWRAVIDSLRPVTAGLWRRLPLDERQRFLRHVRRYWDVHRHRMAPPHADMIEQMRREGCLTVGAGRIRSMQSAPEAVTVTYKPRLGATEETLRVQRVIMASGVENIARTRDPLMQRLMDRGTVRVDRQGLGIDVTDGLNALRADGTVCEHIWALGPIVRGVFWECVAVPDIRVQAAHLAVSVVGRLREDAPRWSFMI